MVFKPALIFLFAWLLSFSRFSDAVGFNYTKGARYIIRDDVTETIAQEAYERVFTKLDSGTPLKKTVYDETNRLLFIAGLEGTGHHAWMSMFKVCIKYRVCISEKPLTDAMQQFDGQNIRGLFGAADTQKNAEQFVFLYQRMKEIALMKRSSPQLRILGLGLGGTSRSGMLSYPNFDGVHKAMDNPDVHMMAAVAEAANVDFRIIVMYRDANAILNSVRRRGWGSDYESKVLAVSADALHTQLEMLDGNFFYCMKFESLGSKSVMESSELINFLYPSLKKVWKEMLQRINFSTFHPKSIEQEEHVVPKILPQGNSSKDEYFDYLNNEYQAKYINIRIDHIQRHCQSNYSMRKDF